MLTRATNSLIAIASTLLSVLAFAKQYPDLCVPTAGVPPHDAKDFVEDDLVHHSTQHYAPLDSQGMAGLVS